MKKMILFAAGLLLAGTLPGLPAAAEDMEEAGQPEIVEIPVVDELPDLQGENVIIKIPVAVTDVDGDGLLTVNDALNLAGDAMQNHPDESNVYVYSVPDLDTVIEQISKNEDAHDPGSDAMNAYVYKEASFFDRSFVMAEPGEAFTLTLSHTGFDENQKLVTAPIPHAVITIDGKETSYVTDGNGRITLNFDEPGTIVLSAVTNIEQCVPPIAKVLVLGDTEPTTEAPTAAPSEPSTVPGQTTAPGETPGTAEPGVSPSQEQPGQPGDALNPTPPDQVTLDSPPTGERGAVGVMAAAGVALFAAGALRDRRRKKDTLYKGRLHK